MRFLLRVFVVVCMHVHLNPPLSVERIPNAVSSKLKASTVSRSRRREGEVPQAVLKIGVASAIIWPNSLGGVIPTPR